MIRSYRELRRLLKISPEGFSGDGPLGRGG